MTQPPSPTPLLAHEECEAPDLVEDVRYSDGLMDRDRLDVYLAPWAQDADARMVWCEVLLPMEIPQAIEVSLSECGDAFQIRIARARFTRDGGLTSGAAGHAPRHERSIHGSA